MRAIVSLLRQPLRRLGFDINRWTPDINRPFDILSPLVREQLLQDPNFFVLQVGANDGVLDDPVRNLIIAHRLPGLLIEPLPDLFEKLKANYASQPQLAFENLAILPSPGEVTIYRVSRDAQLPHHWQGIASFSKRNLLAQGVPEASIHSQRVFGTSLRDIAAKHSLSKVGLLQVDTEGFDYEVVKSAFEAGLRPRLINYEHCWLPPTTRYACKKLLESQGYGFVEVGKDTVAMKQ